MCGHMCVRRPEIRKLAFSIYDPENYGKITQNQLLELLTMLHPKNQGPVTVRRRLLQSRWRLGRSWWVASA